MFVVFSASENPWMVALLVFVQVVVPLLQSNAADEDGDAVVTIALMFILALAIMAFFKFYGVIRQMFRLRGSRPEATWREFIREAHAMEQLRREAAASAQARSAASGRDAEESLDRMMRTIQTMPTEEFQTPDELREASIHELKARLKRRDVEFHGCVERSELVDLLVTFRGGPTNNDTCCICCEEYQSGDVMRLLKRCKHEFHLECLDKWAFTSASASRKPVCPLCNQSLE